MKKFLSLLLVTSIFLSTGGLTAFAEEDYVATIIADESGAIPDVMFSDHPVTFDPETGVGTFTVGGQEYSIGITLNKDKSVTSEGVAF